MDNRYRIVIETGTSDHQWDDFLLGAEGGHHEQSTHWARVKQSQGWLAVRIKVLLGSELRGGAQILYKRLPLVGYVGHILSGPCFSIPADPAVEVLVRAVNEFTMNRKIHYLAIRPYIADEHLSRILEQNGYGLKPDRLPPSSATKATLVLDLAPSIEALLMQMRSNSRRKIKVALRSGLTVREGRRDDLGELFELMASIARRRGEPPAPDSVEIFEDIWDCFHPEGLVTLRMIEFEGTSVAAGFLFSFGNSARLWKVGWSGEYGEMNPTHLLYWDSIKWSRANGFRYFDMVQIDSVVTDRYASGLPITDEYKSRVIYGPTQFKVGFGGDVVKFSGPWIRFQSPVVRSLYRRLGASLLGKFPSSDGASLVLPATSIPTPRSARGAKGRQP